MGAAGGIALATAILNPQLIQGASYFIQKTQLEHQMAKADLIITGEGRYDDQSQMGKITGEIVKLRKRYG
jgi:glycerate kinase